MSKYRVRVEYDEYPDVSWLEQWNSPEKYYEGAPECVSCGCAMQYLSGRTWECQDCEQVLLWESDKGNLDSDGKVIPFDRYMETYGDANNYVFLCAVVERRCEHCGSWAIEEALGGVDFFDDGKDHWETGILSPDDVVRLPAGYFRVTLLELLGEAGWTESPSLEEASP